MAAAFRLRNRTTLRTLRLGAGLTAAALAACSEGIVTTPRAVTSGLDAVPSRAGVRAPLDFIEGQVIVRYRDGASGDEVLARHGKRKKKALGLARTDLVEVEAGQEAAVAAALAADPAVEFAEPDYTITLKPCEVGICQEATDAFNAYKWDLNNPGQLFAPGTNAPLGASGVADADVDWLEMYDALGPTFQGAAVIGILDTGIRPTHSEFTGGRIIAARNFATGYPAELIDDRDGHGTHVAGIAAGRANGVGTSGIAYGANIKLINAKVCELYNFGTATVPDIRTSCPSSSQADAIVWATDNGANVLNLSLGGDPRATSGSAAVRAAMQYARAHNVLPFCAAGNDNYPDIAFPARFPECVAVGATNWNDARASYSNYGADMEISAPGGDSNPAGTPYSYILSSYRNSDGNYAWLAGTSMATPAVVGLAAMVYASGVHDVNEVLARLKSTADDRGPAGWDPQFGAGRINAYRALTLLDPYAPPVSNPGTTSIGTEGAPTTFTGASSFDPNGHPLTYSWSFGDGATSTNVAPAHTYADNGTYTVNLTVTDQSGHATAKSLTVGIANVAPSVNAALSETSILSGASIGLMGGFTDPGANDNPWQWTIDWGNGTSSGTLAVQGAIAGTQRFCVAQGYLVRLSVRDKDGGVGTATQALTVSRVSRTVQLPDAVNLNANGTLPVVFLGTADFDAATLDAATLTLGDGAGVETPVARRNNGSVQATLEDVNKDGRLDLVAHFSRESLRDNGDLRADLARLVARGTMSDGCVQIEGAQTVKIVP